MNNEHIDQGAEGSTGSRTTCLFGESIRGVKVVAADGQIVGEVADLAVDCRTWQVESVQLKLNKDIADNLGVPRGNFRAATIDLPVRMIQSVGDTVLLSVPTAQLRPSVSGQNRAAA